MYVGQTVIKVAIFMAIYLLSVLMAAAILRIFNRARPRGSRVVKPLFRDLILALGPVSVLGFFLYYIWCVMQEVWEKITDYADDVR